MDIVHNLCREVSCGLHSLWRLNLDSPSLLALSHLQVNQDSLSASYIPLCLTFVLAESLCCSSLFLLYCFPVFDPWFALLVLGTWICLCYCLQVFWHPAVKWYRNAPNKASSQLASTWGVFSEGRSVFSVELFYSRSHTCVCSVFLWLGCQWVSLSLFETNGGDWPIHLLVGSRGLWVPCQITL